MKFSIVGICLLVACTMALASENGPLLSAIQPREALTESSSDQDRPKRGLGLIGAGALIGAKAGFIGGALASGAIHGRSYGGYGGYHGGGYYGGGHGHGHYGQGYGYGNGGYGGHGGYGGYGGYSGYGGYGGYGSYGHGHGHGHGYGSYYPSSSYIVSDPWY